MCFHVFFRSKGKYLKLRHQQALLYRTPCRDWPISRSSDLQLMLVWWSKPTKSKSMTTHTLSLSMASPQRMTLMQKSKWNHTPLDSTRTSMATSVLSLFIAWMNALSSFKWALWPCNDLFPNLACQNTFFIHGLESLVVLCYTLWMLEGYQWCMYIFPCRRCTVMSFHHFISVGHSVLYAPVALGSQESPMGRETHVTVHQTPPFPTTATMDLEDSCPSPVRTFKYYCIVG